MNYTIAKRTLPESALYIDVKRNGNRFKVYPHKSVQPTLWSYDKNKCKALHPLSNEINDFLGEWKHQLGKVLLELEVKLEPLKGPKVQELMDLHFHYGKPKEEGDFLTFYDSYLKTRRCSAGYQIILKQNRLHFIKCFGLASKKAIAAWMAMPMRLRHKAKLPITHKLPFSDVNIDKLKEFEQYLYNATFTSKGKEKHYSINYIGKQIKYAKLVIDEAMEEGLVQYFRHKKVVAVSEETDAIYLTYDELQQLLDAKHLTDKEKVVRDIFVFNSFLGLRYSDLHLLDKSCFNDADGELMYLGRALKTDGRLHFPLHPTAAKLVRRYNFAFPEVVDVIYNETLKSVGLKARLNQEVRTRINRGDGVDVEVQPKYKLISSHTARRTFATNAFQSNVTLQTIRAITGHHSEATLMRYIKDTMTAQTMSNELSKMRELKIAS